MLPESFAVLFPAEQFPRNGDQHFKYRQNSDLYYLSGLTQEQCIIVLFKGNDSTENAECAFIIEPDEKMIIWTGHKYTKQEALEVSGIDSVLYLNEFDNLISSLLDKTGTVYYSFRSNVEELNMKILSLPIGKTNLAKKEPIFFITTSILLQCSLDFARVRRRF
jgi:Xaa-Pro aminopeptidase